MLRSTGNLKENVQTSFGDTLSQTKVLVTRTIRNQLLATTNFCTHFIAMWSTVVELFVTQFPESGHHVNKCCNTLAEGLWQVGSEMVAQGEKVVGQVHAVVVLNGS